MACARCGKKTPTVATVLPESGMQKLYDSGEYRVVRYNGPNYVKFIGSPTGVIVKDGLTSYGRGKNGSIILVHKDDINKQPSLFTVLKDEELTKGEKVLGLSHVIESTVKVIPNTAPSTAGIATRHDLNDETVDEAVAEVEEIARKNVAEGRVLSKDEAMSPSEFAKEFGYSHHLQVVAKVKSGELLQYENEDGQKLVYHVETKENV